MQAVTWTLTLRETARRRLASSGLAEDVVRALLDEEPGLGNTWFAYLVLTNRRVIRDPLEPGDRSRR